MMTYSRSQNAWHRYIFIPLLSAYCSWWWLIVDMIESICFMLQLIFTLFIKKYRDFVNRKKMFWKSLRENFSNMSLHICRAWRVKTFCFSLSFPIGFRVYSWFFRLWILSTKTVSYNLSVYILWVFQVEPCFMMFRTFFIKRIW